MPLPNPQPMRMDLSTVIGLLTLCVVLCTAIVKLATALVVCATKVDSLISALKKPSRKRK